MALASVVSSHELKNCWQQWHMLQNYYMGQICFLHVLLMALIWAVLYTEFFLYPSKGANFGLYGFSSCTHMLQQL